jgi:hypothetical protein
LSLETIRSTQEGIGRWSLFERPTQILWATPSSDL